MSPIAAPHASPVWTVVIVIAVLIIIVSVVLQYRALNRMAFGRSMFISGCAIFFGFVVALLPSLAATVVATVLFLIGLGFMILMGWKSYMYLLTHPRR